MKHTEMKMYMGFTRFWTRPEELDAEKFKVFSDECRECCEKLESELGIKLSDKSFTNEEVRFEGVPSCETFLIRQFETDGAKEGRVLEFSKTNQRPYDEAVRMCLELLKKNFNDVKILKPR